MQVLLRHNIEKLGNRGDIIKVKDGYARNYLIPQGLAITASAGAVKQFKFERRKLEKEEDLRLEGLKATFEQLGNFELTMEMKANEEGHLFGAVTDAMICKALNDAGFEVGEKQVKLEQPIKELGIYKIPVSFEGEVRAEIKLWVVEAKESDAEMETDGKQQDKIDSAENGTAGKSAVE
ncbi:50S ribosomal protein L9 [Planctomycetota bacterium]